MKHKLLQPASPAKMQRRQTERQLCFALLLLGLSTLSCITTEDIFGLARTKLSMQVSGFMTLRMFESEPVTIDLSESSDDCWRDSWTENRDLEDYSAHHYLMLYCLDSSVWIKLRIPLDQDSAIKNDGIGISEQLAVRRATPEKEKLKEGCRYSNDLRWEGTEVISDHRSGTDFPIEFRTFSIPGSPHTAEYCIDFDMHILIPRQEQGVPYEPKTPPVPEFMRNAQTNNPSEEQTNE